MLDLGAQEARAPGPQGSSLFSAQAAFLMLGVRYATLQQCCFCSCCFKSF